MLRRGLAVCLLLACRSAPSPRSGEAIATLREAPHTRALESITLDDASPTATFRTPLDAGAIYLLKAEGAAMTGAQAGHDAEFAFHPGANATEFADAVGAVDVGIDVGVKQVLPATGRKAAPPSDQRLKWLRSEREHVYYLLVTGAGVPLSLRLVALPGPPGKGKLVVSMFALSPAPPALGPPLETVLVPARDKVLVRTALVARPSTVYLLQAAGEVQVGGPGAMGDAEFHDYHPDGRGFNEGEAGVDFGLGVDEPTVGEKHDPRERKWGAFRIDHTYYMLYTGRDQPIELNYHDTGGKSGVYKDNDGFLPVSIFAAP
jgi:hypothetical protein